MTTKPRKTAAKKTAKKPPAPHITHQVVQGVGPNSIDMKVGLMIQQACRTFLDPGDHVEYSAAFFPLSDDTGWIPSVFVYVMIQPVGEADGAHMGQPVSPYQVTQELVDIYVQEFAEATVDERLRIRNLRAAGETESLGLVIDG